MNTLDHASAAYAEGRLALAAEIAEQCLRRARLRKDDRLAAGSLRQLCQVHLAAGDITAALREAQQAQLEFESLHDVQGEALASVAVAYAASYLRQGDLALAAGTNALRLSAAIGDPVMQAMAHNYHGVALLWTRDADGADAALRNAVKLARRGHSKTAEVLALRNRVSAEIYWLQTDRIFERGEDDPAALTALLSELNGLDPAGSTPMRPAGYLDGAASSALLNALAACWHGRLREARDLLGLCAGLLRADPSRSAFGGLHLIQPYYALARCEHARAVGDRAGTVRWAEAAITAARRAQNYQVAWLGSALRLEAFETLGLHNEAARGWRLLLGREYDWSEAGTPRVRPDRRGRRQRGVAGRSQAIDVVPSSERSDAELWDVRYGLTTAELAIARLVAQGLRPQRIASIRGTSIGTVRYQLHQIFQKTGFDSQQALIAALRLPSDPPAGH